MSWNPHRLPDLTGRTILITGANSGLGYFSTEQLTGAGAHVIMSGRNAERVDAAARVVRERVPGASVETHIMDVADLSSVRDGAERLLERESLDGVMANAGSVHPPRRREETVDGNERVLATNHLGHFALIARLMPLLERTPGSRVVSIGSLASRLTWSHLRDLQLVDSYNASIAYAQSKIASQVFGFELDRRLRAASAPVSSLVAHPGYSIGGLTPRIQHVNEPDRRKRFTDNLIAWGAQGKDAGAWSQVRAMSDPDAVSGDYWGPIGLVKGRPVLQTPTAVSRDPQVAASLWAASEEFTGVEFAI